MKQLKFRYWNGSKVLNQEAIINHLNKYIARNNKHLMQFTGLLDKQGVEIYEEDFIKDKDHIFIVKWQSGGFILSPIEYSKNYPYIGRQIVDLQNAQYIFENCEVIGNIYENKKNNK